MKRMIVDMDEVIADTTKGMEDWYKNTYGGVIDYAKMVGESFLKGFPDEHQPIIRQRLYEPGFFRHLPIIDGSVEVLKQLNRSYEVFIVSAATEFPNSLTEKYEWLMEHFPFLSWKQLVLCGEKRMIQADIMIDDHVRHLQHFHGKAYLFSAPHNLNETEYTRLNSWQEAPALFL